MQKKIWIFHFDLGSVLEMWPCGIPSPFFAHLNLNSSIIDPIRNAGSNLLFIRKKHCTYRTIPGSSILQYKGHSRECRGRGCGCRCASVGFLVFYDQAQGYETAKHAAESW